MKKLHALLVFLITVNFSYAQLGLFLKGKPEVASLRIGLSGFSDQYSDMTPEGLLSMIRSGQTYDFDVNNYVESSTGAVFIGGGNLSLDLSLNPRRIDGTVNTNHEIRIGASLNFDREAMIDVQIAGGTGDFFNPYEFVTLCTIENEFILQTAYLFKTQVDIMSAPVFELYAGPGIYFGSTFNNEFIFLGGPEQTLDAKGSNYIRASAVFGASALLGQFSLSLEGRYGVGAQIVHNAQNNVLNSYTLGVGLAYFL